MNPDRYPNRNVKPIVTEIDGVKLQIETRDDRVRAEGQLRYVENEIEEVFSEIQEYVKDLRKLKGTDREKVIDMINQSEGMAVVMAVEDIDINDLSEIDYQAIFDAVVDNIQTQINELKEFQNYKLKEFHELRDWLGTVNAEIKNLMGRLGDRSVTN